MALMTSPMRAVRQHCIDCQAGNFKAVRFCTCDGIHSTLCPLWLLRFGKRPATVAKELGVEFITPGALPGPDVHIDDCNGKA